MCGPVTTRHTVLPYSHTVGSMIHQQGYKTRVHTQAQQALHHYLPDPSHLNKVTNCQKIFLYNYPKCLFPIFSRPVLMFLNRVYLREIFDLMSYISISAAACERVPFLFADQCGMYCVLPLNLLLIFYVLVRHTVHIDNKHGFC